MDFTWPSSVIFVGSNWYSASRVSPMQFAECFYNHGSRVLWIDSIPIRFPSAKQRDFWAKVQSTARSRARFLTRPRPNFYVYSPVYIPIFSSVGRVASRIIATAQFLVLRRILGFNKSLVVGSGFTPWYVIDAIKNLPFVFHFADKISAFRETSALPTMRRALEHMEMDIIEACTLITCSSHAIYNYVRTRSQTDMDKVIYLPHGVDSAFLQGKLSTESSTPDDMRQISHPIAGYFGSLTEANDKATFYYAAQKLPGWSFVFIGEVRGDYEKLSKLENVYFLGRKPHTDIPLYGRLFDVAFMGWTPHEWIENSFPVKTLEYLALGKPVVCTSPVAELRDRYPGFVRITNSPEEFVKTLQEEHQNNTLEHAAKRLSLVRNETWDQRAMTLLQSLAKRGDYEF